MKKITQFSGFVLLFVLLHFGCTAQSDKINGVSFVASSKRVTTENVNPVVKVNANYACLMPFGFIRSLEHPEVVFNTDRQWFGERKDGVAQYTEELRKQQLKIMIKPQIWVGHGEFTGQIEMNSESDWKTLETSYENFILNYAEQAQILNAEIFCIGTELELFVKNRPNFWNNLIKAVRKVYKGAITYAANWNEYEKTPFWGELDYIGVDAYFPISEEKTLTVEAGISSFQKYKKILSDKVTLYNKKVLFTEFGFRSVDYNGKQPWDSKRIEGNVNMLAQANALQALFESFWSEDWMAGGFVWKWFANHKQVGGIDNNRFTPQNKLGEDIIQKYYKK